MIKETAVKALEKESFKKRILIIILAILSMAAVVLVSINTTTALAEDEADTTVEYDETAAFRAELDDVFSILAEQDEQLSKIVNIVAPGELAEELYGSEFSGETIADVLLYKAGSPAHMGINVTSVIGMMILMVYGIIQIVKIAKDDKGSIESWLQLAIIMVIGVLALAYVRPIMNFLDRLGLRLFAGIQRSIVGEPVSQAYSEAYERMWDAFLHQPVSDEALTSPNVYDNSSTIPEQLINRLIPVLGTMFMSVRNYFIGGVFKILMFFTYYSILVSVYGLLFELVIRRIFTPIAITGVAVEGIRSPGVRYLKNYFSLYIRLAMFVVIISLSCKASSWALSHMREYSSQLLGDGRFFWQQASSDTRNFWFRTIFMLGGNLANNITVRPFLNVILTITCIRAATKALMNTTAGIAKEVVGGNG